MKKFLKIVMGIIVLFIAIFTIVMFITRGLVDTADRFFMAIKADDYNKAYTFLSEDFRNNTSKEELRKYMVKNSFSNFKKANWGKRSINSNIGELSGSIVTDSDGVIPLTISFIKGAEQWKIHAIKKPRTGLLEEKNEIEIPSKKQQIKLTVESMEVFAQSVKDKNMTKLFSHVSNMWQKQLNTKKLEEAFGDFYPLYDKLLPIRNSIPNFTQKASIDQKGLLVLEGFFSDDISIVFFELDYIHEITGWKLFAINVKIKRASNSKKE